MGRELGNPWNYLNHRTLVEKSLESSDEEERLQALGLLVESHSSVERFHRLELDTVRRFLERHLAPPSAAARQVLLAHLKKMITRIRDGALAVQKKLTQERLRPEHPELEDVLASYTAFLSSLTVLLVANLFHGANFARRVTVLELLTLIDQIVGFASPPSCLDIRSALSPASCSVLYRCLYDTFEENKQKALNILRQTPPHYLG